MFGAILGLNQDIAGLRELIAAQAQK